MKEQIKVPAMGESITEAIIGEIIKSSGSTVEAEDEIIELETDKVNQVLYAPTSGVITWNVQTEDTVQIGQVIGAIDTEQKGEKIAESPPAPPQEEQKPPLQPADEPVPATGAARLTKEEAIAQITSEAPSVAAQPPPLATPPPAPKPTERRRKMSKIRRTIATRLVKAQQNSAMLTTFNEIDLSELIKVRAQHKESFIEQHGVKLGFMSFFVKGVVSALGAFPEINASIDNDEIVEYTTYDIGIAIGTERGLIVPVVRGCDRLTFAEIEQAIATYASQAKNKTLSADALQGGSFTITNGGVYGSLLSTPILNPPQSAILGMHTIQKRPVAVGDQVVIRPMMYVALSYDHRLVDGKEAVSFLVHLKNHLEDPAKLLLET